MNLEVVFTPGGVEESRLEGKAVVVIDVLRATSTIIEALENGASAVIPVDTIERAVEAASQLGDDVLLCGERNALPIDGFDLGNSPLQFGPGVVTDHTLVMTTTNGTRALLKASAGESCVIGSLLNAGAVAELVADADDVVLLCAGRQGQFAMEDAVCAGLIGRGLAELTALRATDAARAAIALAGRYGESPDVFLRHTAAGRNLRQAGLADDIEFCASVDRYTHVPAMHDLRITL